MNKLITLLAAASFIFTASAAQAANALHLLAQVNHLQAQQASEDKAKPVSQGNPKPASRSQAVKRLSGHRNEIRRNWAG